MYFEGQAVLHPLPLWIRHGGGGGEGGGGESTRVGGGIHHPRELTKQLCKEGGGTGEILSSDRGLEERLLPWLPQLLALLLVPGGMYEGENVLFERYIIKH